MYQAGDDYFIYNYSIPCRVLVISVISEHDGLVEDLGATIYGFEDIIVVEHLCAKVTGHERSLTLWTHRMSWRNA